MVVTTTVCTVLHVEFMDTVKDNWRGCILLSTCDKYRPVAGLTLDLLHRFWPDHPPIYACGLNDGIDTVCLKREGDPEDWLSVTGDACQALMKDGFRWAYLILDDHPPLDLCHNGHLNTTLPRLLRELDAVCIGLNGWGYSRDGRRPNGKVLSVRYYLLEQLSADFKWKFSLHPTLWDLAKFKALLEALRSELPKSVRTPWNFERLSGRPGMPLSFDYLSGAYRVCGLCMGVSKWRGLGHIAKYRYRQLEMSAKTKMFGDRRDRDTDERAHLLAQYYYGPYPLFWSGVMTKGALNTTFMKYLGSRRDTYLLNRVNAIRTAK